MLTMNDLLDAFGIIHPTQKLKKHPKMQQILNFCNDNGIDVYEHEKEIQEDAFCILLDEIHSVETLLKIINNTGVFLSLNYYPREIAIFYNLYNPDILQYSEYTEILIDPEYLKYATKEWTEHQFLQQTKVLKVSGQRLSLRENPSGSSEEDFVESYLFNLEALKEAKEKNLLKEAIEKISE